MVWLRNEKNIIFWSGFDFLSICHIIFGLRACNNFESTVLPVLFYDF